MDIIKHNMAELVLALNHNYRAEKTTNTAFKANNDYFMLGCKDFKELQQRAFNTIAEREDAYTKRTKQKVQAKTAKAVEIILEINEDTTAQELMESYGEYFKNEFGAEVLGIAVHRDEGYLIGLKPPYRRLTSGIEFELDQESGKYYELKSNGKTYERGKELDISNFKEYKNLHAQILISNLRTDGSSIATKHDDFKCFNKNFFKDFSNNWQKIYNEKFPNKTPLEKAKKPSDEPKTSVFEPMLEIIADKIIQGTRNKQKLSESLAQYLQDNNEIKRIKSFKHFLARLNKLAYTDESLNQRDYKTFLSQMRESGANVRLQQILLQKLSQMDENELKEQNIGKFDKFFRMVKNIFEPVEIDKQEQEQPKEPLKELELAKEKIKELKAENEELKKQNQEQKAENKELKESLENARQEINSIIQLFKDLPELLDTARFKTKNFLALLKNRIKAKIKKADNGSEVAQISTKNNLNDKSYTQELKTLKNAQNEKLSEIATSIKPKKQR